MISCRSQWCHLIWSRVCLWLTESEENQHLFVGSQRHTCLVPTNARGMDLSWHCILLHHCLHAFGYFGKDSRQTAIIIWSGWDYLGTWCSFGLQPLQVKSDFCVNQPVQASGLWHVCKLARCTSKGFSWVLRLRHWRTGCFHKTSKDPNQ